MTITKKLTVSALVLSMLTVSMGELPISYKGFTEKLGFAQTVNAAEVGQLASPLFDRMNELYAALAAGGPADVKAVMDLRDELAVFDYKANRQLIDPIWLKIRDRIPASVDRTELKTGVYELIQAVGAIQNRADLEAFRSDPKFRETLKVIGAASGDPNVGTDDLLVFLFGDGGSRLGLEGTVRSSLGKMSLIELVGLVGNSKATSEVLLQAIDKQLSETDTYRISSILKALDISSLDIRSLVVNVQAKLVKDDAALNAISFAYVRSSTVASAVIGDSGRKHTYTLKTFGNEIPSLVLKWSKVSGSNDVTVAPNGVITIPEGVPSGTAVVQAKIVNPYGKFSKVVFEKEITLTDETVVEDNVFPVEQFLQRWSKIRDALIAGGPSDVNSVRKLRDEMMGMNFAKEQSLINPIWNPIAQKLPASVDQVELKKSLLDIFQAVGSLPFDVQASQLEEIIANTEFKATLKTIATAAGVPTLTIDDILIMMFGDGKDHVGVEGTVRNTIANMSSKELSKLLSNKNGLAMIQASAMTAVLNDKTGYALSDALHNLGVTPNDLASMVLNLRNQLKHDEPAIKALSAAYIRSETVSTVKVTENGRQHNYGVTVLGVELPSSSLKWKKVSGSKDVKVDAKGKVTISDKIETGAVVIQASLLDFFGGSSKVIFEQEVTLVNGDYVADPSELIQRIVKNLESTIIELKQRLSAATTDSEKAQLIVEVVQAGNESYDQINQIKAPKGIKNKAISNVKKQVTQMTDLIIKSLMKF